MPERDYSALYDSTVTTYDTSYPCVLEQYFDPGLTGWYGTDGDVHLFYDNGAMGVRTYNSWMGPYVTFPTEPGQGYTIRLYMRWGSDYAMSMEAHDSVGTGLLNWQYIYSGGSMPITMNFTANEMLSGFKLSKVATHMFSDTIYIDSIFICANTPHIDTITKRVGSAAYRYGFNGKENDDDVKGNGNSLDFGARIYDSRLGRWFSVDPLQQKYPGLTPYNFTANAPTKFVDFDGKDFGVDVDHSTKTIVIKMNIYTTSENAYNQANNAVGEINQINTKVLINGVEYQTKFQVSVIAASSTARNDAQNDPIGNVYNGTTQGTIAQNDGNGNYSAVGGTTSNGWDVQMNTVTFPDDGASVNMGAEPQLVAHEFLHLMGQNDEKNGPFFDKSGRMKYTASRNNGFQMQNISDGDVVNIVDYAQQFGTSRSVKKPGEKDKVHAAQAIITEKGEGKFKFSKVEKVEKK